jgi:SAM-dependent methyltransferase
MAPPTSSNAVRWTASIAEDWRILRAALRIRRDPLPFVRLVSAGVPRYLADRGLNLAGSLVLDAGTGGGAIPEALAGAGCRVIALDVKDHRLAEVTPTRFVMGRGEHLPFRDGAFDGVVSSNVLEHVADTWGTVSELVRVCRPGGFVYLSWTNWLSPLGGHEMSPFHYLGPGAAVRAYRLTRGRDPSNVPGRTLHRVDVGGMLRGLRGQGLEVVDVAPRYWPWLRVLSRAPGLREFVLWNCVILVRVAGGGVPLMPNVAWSAPGGTRGTPPAS